MSCGPRCECRLADSKSRATSLQETGGRFNAIHVRSTDWAQQYPEWYIEPENVAPKALQVTTVSDRDQTSPLCFALTRLAP